MVVALAIVGGVAVLIVYGSVLGLIEVYCSPPEFDYG